MSHPASPQKPQLFIFFLLFLVNAVAGAFQILILGIFIIMEEGSIMKLKESVVNDVFCDFSTVIMILPTIFMIISDQLLLVSSEILPISRDSANNYSVVAVAFFSILMLKKRMFLTQLIAIALVVAGVNNFPDTGAMYEGNEAFVTLKTLVHAKIAFTLAIMCTGLSWVILEKVLKSSEASLWIRGIQLNIFLVPLSFLMIYGNAWFKDEPMAIFDDFNIIAWFFVIFKAAQQMMVLFVLKIADSVNKCFAFSIAFVIMGVIKNPFMIGEDWSPEQLGTGLVLAGICLYSILDNCFTKIIGEEESDVESEIEYRESPNVDSLSKGYQVIQPVSIINADSYLKMLQKQPGDF